MDALVVDNKKTKEQLIRELEELREEVVVLNQSLKNDNISDSLSFNQIEQLLKSSERKNQAMLEHSPICTKVVDLDFKLRYMSSAGIEALLIDDITKHYGKSFPLSFYPDSFKKHMSLYLNKAKKSKRIVRQEAAIVNKNGRELWFHSTIVPVCDDNGEINYYLILSVDITERKEFEKKLIESNEKNRLLIESSPYCIHQIDMQGKLVSMNKAGLAMLNANDEHSIIGLEMLEFVHNNDKNRIKLLLKDAYKGITSQFEFIAKNDSVFASSFVPIKDDSGNVLRIMGITQNITETKRLQELESRAERLEVAGIIAGQVAHDFNNLLAPIIAYPEFIREELPHDHSSLTFLNSIEDAAKKIAVINQDLLTMGRRGHYNQKNININNIVLQAVKEFELNSDKLNCITNLSLDIMKIKGGEAQIHRMISNLLVNAQDAVDIDGTITISTENYYTNETTIAFGCVPKGEYVKLTVNDNGCGIPNDIINKILDPFFSTKTANTKRGSGLGLSVVDAVMKDHHGYLDLNSEVGNGTSFYLYFPIEREVVEDYNLEKLKSGTEKILVVDDDKLLREVSTVILGKLGYKVNTVASGKDAITFLQKNPQDLILLDMIMPGGIDGTDTYRKILEFNSDQKVIIISGFAESKRVIEARKLGMNTFVKKPFTKEEISNAIRIELDYETKVTI